MRLELVFLVSIPGLIISAPTENKQYLPVKYTVKTDPQNNYAPMDQKPSDTEVVKQTVVQQPVKPVETVETVVISETDRAIQKPVNWLTYWRNWFRDYFWGNNVPKGPLGHDDRKWFAHAKIYADE